MKKFFKWLFIILISLQVIVLIAGVVIFRMPLPDHEVDVSGLPLNDFIKDKIFASEQELKEEREAATASMV